MSRVLLGLGVVAVAVAGCSSSGGGPALGAGTGTPAAHVSTTAGTTSQSTSPSAAATSTGTSSSAAPVGGGGAPHDVCGLLSAAEASRLNNVHYGATSPRHVATGFDECTYDNTGNAPDPVDIQNLHVKVITLPDCFAQLGSTDGGHHVAGVGDDALGYSIGLLVKTGSSCVDITGLTHAELNGNWAPDIAMAKLILGRLH